MGIIRAYRITVAFNIDWKDRSDDNYFDTVLSLLDAAWFESIFMAFGIMFLWAKLLRYSPIVYPKMGLFVSMVRFVSNFLCCRNMSY